MIRLRQAIPGHGWPGLNTHAFGPFDLDVNAGTAMAVIGPNGSGKSLLLALVAGVLRVSSGSVEVVGKVGYAPSALVESPAVRCDELLDFIAIEAGLRGRDRRQAVDRALSMAGTGDRPDGRVDRLPDGKRKRLLIASALLCDPDVLLLDDPMQSLDPAGRSEVERLVADTILAGKCVLAAINDASIGSCWTEIAIMRSGQIHRTLSMTGPWLESTRPRGEDLLGT
ncbi:MAG: ATP-binding cassette domain-containing protein [Planctomycetaceae bacterium]